MEWQQTGVLLSVKRHGETSAIVDVFTREHGRWKGLVRGGRSRKMRPVLQPGNVVEATWRARLADHLGSFAIEPVSFRAARLIDDPLKLAGLTALTELTQVLPEREAHAQIYDAMQVVLDALDDDDMWPALLVRWELGLLDDLGYGLDLTSCVATGVNDNLMYVSPKSARAVSASAGEPYREKLMTLPPFLTGAGMGPPTTADIVNGFMLTGYFLNRHLFAARGISAPESRGWIIDRLKRKTV
jgi:DNA repair protein RecO (recombination protein O)